ncbi:plasmid stabilization protein ParE [Labrys okinawensis]|uniref:Plasmid stabilization protein ParE n=1 Tax=Labrys okinawensis TaxID=346911 RepID=A0A2S9Q9T3_9HYPH|nr:type II toxin-antitoxin system RelE/ParE family toxin [Labrys okinawensis]PRH86070.1 plasmid stabilization protein ParE [Labrys okinawensis]
MNYALTDDAETDLRAIVRYTHKEWGGAQARTYIAKLKAGIARVAAGQGVFKELNALYPALRMARCEHHYVFCLPRQDEPVLIVAIFHERMDLMARLADRLNESQ